MDPVTHLLASYTLGRATRARINSPQMAVVLLAGLVPDVDWLWHLPGPLAPMRAYGTATHSVLGAGVLAAAVAIGVWAIARKYGATPPRMPGLLVVSFTAAGLHLLLDLSTSPGIEPWWPFRITRAAWNLTPTFDAVALVLLVLFAVIPLLLEMVKEEIGARLDPRPSRFWPIAALFLVSAWLGARAVLHDRAEHMLGAAQYMGSAPLHWAAFPTGAYPFRWRGVVETESFLAETEVTVGSVQIFNPDSAAIHYKPEASPAVDAIGNAPLARAYTALARFPILTLEIRADGTSAELQELGDSLLHTHNGTWSVLIQLNADSHLTGQDLFYIPAKNY